MRGMHRIGVLVGVSLSLPLLAACATQRASLPAKPVAPVAVAAPPVLVDPNVYVNAEIGFELTKPSGWLFAPSTFQKEQLGRVSLGSAAMNEAIRKRATEPIVIVTKHAETTDSFNPVIKIIYRPNPGKPGTSALAIAKGVTAEMSKAFEWFELDGEVQAVTVGGLPAAYYQSFLDMQMQDGRRLHALSRAWLVPRGDHLFMIGMSAPTEGDDASAQEFEAVLRSIKIAAR